MILIIPQIKCYVLSRNTTQLQQILLIKSEFSSDIWTYSLTQMFGQQHIATTVKCVPSKCFPSSYITIIKFTSSWRWTQYPTGHLESIIKVTNSGHIHAMVVASISTQHRIQNCSHWKMTTHLYLDRKQHNT